jgi:hypothetical protein
MAIATKAKVAVTDQNVLQVAPLRRIVPVVRHATSVGLAARTPSARRARTELLAAKVQSARRAPSAQHAHLADPVTSTPKDQHRLRAPIAVLAPNAVRVLSALLDQNDQDVPVDRVVEHVPAAP